LKLGEEIFWISSVFRVLNEEDEEENDWRVNEVNKWECEVNGGYL